MEDAGSTLKWRIDPTSRASETVATRFCDRASEASEESNWEGWAVDSILVFYTFAQSNAISLPVKWRKFRIDLLKDSGGSIAAESSKYQGVDLRAKKVGGEECPLFRYQLLIDTISLAIIFTPPLGREKYSRF